MANFKNGIDETVEQRKFRHVYRLVPQKVEMEALREGDLFIILPATKADKTQTINAKKLYHATSDGIVEEINDILGRRNAAVDYETAKIVVKGNQPMDLDKILSYIKGEEDWKLEE
jgi:hypothetical protein